MRICLPVRLLAGFSLLLAAAFAQEQAADLSAQNATIHRSSGGVSLSGPSQDAPGQIIADFLRANGRSNLTANSLVTVSEYTANGGVTHVRMEQQFNGLKVHGAYVRASFNAQGELVHLIEMLVPAVNVGRANIDEDDALQSVVGQLYPSARPNLSQSSRDGNTVSFSHNGFFHQNPTVTLVIAPLAGGSLQEGFLVETWTEQSNLLHHTLVSGNGQILSSELRTNLDSYNIFPDHPGNSSQTVTAGAGAGNAESPNGWLDGSQTTVDIAGNNVHAYLDTDANNSPDSGGEVVSSGNFITAANLGQEPESEANREVAVQNLFYFNNVIHDKLYEHGFVEAVGNFQEDNFDNGGAGGDSVNAEAQDGSGLNNANFSTPSDGGNPRMQMYVWNLTSPKRDGDLDSDIIYHEYGHGLTWRMIGGMSGPMSGAIGEGMSDVLAILMNDDDKVGEYSYNNLENGIRSRFYSGYETYRTYGDFTGSSVHRDGEIYAAAVWKLWELWQQETLSQDDLFDDLIGGMNFTPSGPAMEDMRDGILAAAPAERDCFIWEAFAALGIGEGAKGTVKGGGPFGGGRVTVNESFTVPSACSGDSDPISISTSSLPDGTVDVEYSEQVTTTGGSGAPSWSLIDAPNWLSVNSNGFLSGTPPTTGDFEFTVTVEDTTGSDSRVLSIHVNAAPSGGVPEAPSNLSASAKRGFIRLIWNDNSNNETTFLINRCEGLDCSQIASVPADTTNYRDSDVVNGQTYTYTVGADNASGTSISNSVEITKQ